MASYIAIYLRLSLEDADLKDGEQKDESNSIHSQRLLLQQYIGEKADFAGLPVLEFVDDGYTGTNFERPQFQRMLAMIRSGEISCVIVKDLSRFGRNYLEVGDYLEHIFPFLGVRFIAVNDQYDSNSYLGTTGGVDVAFRNLVYQRYSQDLSEKVKSAMHMKMTKGKYVTHCPYGYQKKPGVKHTMILDPVTAPVVRQIFEAAIAGKKSTEIAMMLNDQRIPTPMEYKKLSRKGMHNETMWSHQAVLRIIKDYKYTGAMVNFKCENATIRAKAQRRMGPEEWVVVEDSHEAIVTHEEYELANASIRKVKAFTPVHSDQKDRVYYCAYCGRRLRKTYGLDEYYSCATQLYRSGCECSEIYWSKSDLEAVILAAYKAQLALMHQEHKLTRKPQADPLVECRQKQRQISGQVAACSSQNLQLYEQYKAGSFDKEAFLEQKAALTERKGRLENELLELQEAEGRLIHQLNEQSQRSQVFAASESKLQASDEELKVMMYEAIDKVVVYASREIEIHWKLNNSFENITQTKGNKVS